MIETSWMFVTGCSLIGWLAPEIFAVILKRGIPITMNMVSSLGFGLIAASLKF